MDARPLPMELLVLTHADRRLALVRDDDGQHFLDVDGDRLCQVVSDCDPLLLGDEIIFAGLEGEGAHHVTLDPIGLAPVVEGAWLTFPVPFTPGQRVAVAWRDEAGAVLRTYTTPPLDRRELEAGWTGYAPQ